MNMAKPYNARTMSIPDPSPPRNAPTPVQIAASETHRVLLLMSCKNVGIVIS